MHAHVGSISWFSSHTSWAPNTSISCALKNVRRRIPSSLGTPFWLRWISNFRLLNGNTQHSWVKIPVSWNSWKTMMHSKHLEHGPRIPTPRPRVRDGRKAAAGNWNRAFISWKYFTSFPRAPPWAEIEKPQWINCQHFHHWLVSQGLLASPVWGIFVFQLTRARTREISSPSPVGGQWFWAEGDC